MMKIKHQKAGQQGFTLLEVALSLGLAGLVSLALYTLWVGSAQKIVSMEQDIELSTDIESGLRILLRDLKNVDPTFSTIPLVDDNGRKMFEYFPDVPEDTLVDKYGKEPKCPNAYPLCRSYTLSAGGKAEIVFLLHDTGAHEKPSLIFDPSKAYDQRPFGTPPNVNRNRDGTVTYLHVNQTGSSATTLLIGDPSCPELRLNGTLVSAGCGARPTVKDGGTTNKFVLYPGYWRPKALLMFDTPSLYRSQNMVNPEDEEPRPAYFLGFVNGTNPKAPFDAVDPSHIFTQKFFITPKPPTIPTPTKDQTNLLDRRHPVVPSEVTDTIDKFFRRLPPVGGGQPLVRLRPVRLVRYRAELMYPEITASEPDLKKRKLFGLLRIWRYVYTDGAWHIHKHRQIVAENVKSLTFRRNTITEKALFFSISRTE